MSGNGSRGTCRLVCRFAAIAVLAFSVVILLASEASAQFSMIGDPPPRFEWQGRVGADYRAEFKTRSSSGDAFDAWRAGIEGDVGGPINQSILVGMGMRYAHSSYDFNLDGPSPDRFGGPRLPRAPWNTINTVDLLPSATILVGDRVTVRTAVPIRYAGESGARRNGFAAGISALVRWQVDEDIAIGLGLGVTSQLEKSAETFPIVALSWRINERLTLQTEGDWFQGGRTTLFWGANDAIRLTLSAGYERTRFRLDDNGTAADTNGIGEVTTVPIEVGLRLKMASRAWLDFRTGLGIGGRIRVETPNGKKRYEQEYDPAPRVGVFVTFPIGLSSRTAPPPGAG